MSEWDWKNAWKLRIKQNLFLPIIQCWVWGSWIWETAVNFESLNNNPSARPGLCFTQDPFPHIYFTAFFPHSLKVTSDTSQNYSNFNLGMQDAKNRKCIKVFFSFFLLLFLLGFRRRKYRWEVHKTYIWRVLTAANLSQSTYSSWAAKKRLSCINNVPASKQVELYRHAADYHRQKSI